MLAQTGLPTGIEDKMAFTRMKQLKMNLGTSWLFQQPQGDVPVVGTDRLFDGRPK